MAITYKSKNKQARFPRSATKRIPPEDMHKLISITAYCLAEQRKFEGNYQLHDWLEAEAKVNHMYGSGK